MMRPERPNHHGRPNRRGRPSYHHRPHRPAQLLRPLALMGAAGSLLLCLAACGEVKARLGDECGGDSDCGGAQICIDSQCIDGACIELDFQGAPHGAYCLAEPSLNCVEPFSVTIAKPSINGVAAVDRCGPFEDLATCEAVLALGNNWRCPGGTDGMCGPNNEPEVAVPGAVCQPVGGLGDRCTYECAGPVQCPAVVPQDTCGGGPPNWCGG